MTRRRLSPAEARAWRAVARRVKPRVDKTEVFDPDSVDSNQSTPKPATGITRLPRDEPFRATRAKPPERPADRGREKRIRRGQAPIHGRLDLHGYTQASGHAALLHFVRQQRHAGARCVLVITGKGRGGDGILRRRFLDWIEMPAFRDHVSGFAVSHQRHGGEGAFYLFLRRLHPGETDR